MPKAQPLKNQRIAVLATDGFEQIELVVPIKAYRAAGATVEIVSLRRGRIRGMNLHEPAGRVRVNRTLSEVSARDFDGLMIPGGFINPDLLRQSANARAFTRDFHEAGKPIATLCHGPWLLASAGLARDRTLTSWPGIRDDLVHAGATWLDQEVVRDGLWVSSRGPHDIKAFVQASIDLFSGLEPSASTTGARIPSAPQRDEPAKLVVSAMKWLPRPSVRAVLGIGLLGFGWWAVTKEP